MLKVFYSGFFPLRMAVLSKPLSVDNVKNTLQYILRYHWMKYSALWMLFINIYFILYWRTKKIYENSEAVITNKTRMKWLKRCIYWRITISIIKNISHSFKGNERNNFVKNEYWYIIHTMYKALFSAINIEIVANSAKPGDDKIENTDILGLSLFVICKLTADIIIMWHILKGIKSNNKTDIIPIWRLYSSTVWASCVGECLLSNKISWYLPFIIVYTISFVLKAQRITWKKDIVLIVYSLFVYKNQIFIENVLNASCDTLSKFMQNY